MLTSDNHDLTSCQKQPSPDHAVWGDVQRPTAASILRYGLRQVLRLAALAFFVACGLAMAGSKLSSDLQQMLGGNGNIEVIVQFTRIPTATDLQLFSANQIVRRFRHIKAVHALLTPAEIRALESNPLVTYMSPNRAVSGTLDITTQTVGANVAWQSGWNGTGIGVAVVDSGIFAHDDLMTTSGKSSRIVYTQSFVTGLTGTDLFGHGTHVAGIIGSNGKDSTGAGFTRTFNGVAPNVNLVNLQVLDQNGSGSDSNVIAAIDEAISLQSTYNIRVLNLSLGQTVYESYKLDPLCQAAEAAWSGGIVVVVAAGNAGRNVLGSLPLYGTITSPGNDPYVITVGATNTHGSTNVSGDTVASYSSDGPTSIDHIAKPDLVAPGDNIVSLMAPNNTLETTYPTTLTENSYYESGNPAGTSATYFCLSGTSMATPVVSGAAALLIQKSPSLTPDQVKARLMKTATKTFSLYTSAQDIIHHFTYNNISDLFTIGAGQVNIAAALGNTDLTDVPAISPLAIMNSNGQVTLM
ncbi:MAG TPA: S8 family peptidase, partial [Bryobacteraceae bacterium]|nr:S8 family peptidase [Bryobacteraceae bacterium]